MNQCQSRILGILLVAANTLLTPPAPRAQTSQATLQGQITNRATGQPVARVLVIERNLQTNSQAYRYTNEQGLYYFSALLPGTYTVRADALGFQPEERPSVDLPVASQIELNFALNPTEKPPATVSPARPPGCASPTDILCVMYGSDAAVPQALMVSLPLEATETLIGAVSSLIDERKILELPLSGRDVYTLLVLQPGVTSDNATARGLGFSVNGQRVSSSNFLLDGVDNNDQVVTGPATLVSADAVKEYRMTTNNFTAEFGRSSGFIANAITRTGGNTLHGTVFEFFNQDRLNANSFANNWQGAPREPFHQNQFGASLGGPVRRDRLFFFGNIERFQSSSESPPSEVFVPSSLFVSALPPGSLGKELLTLFPPPNGQSFPGNPFVAVTNFSDPLTQRNTFAMGRMDYNSPGGKHHLSGRYAFSQETSDDLLFSVYPGLNAPLVARGQNLALNYIRDLLGGSNEMKFGYNRNSVSILRPHPTIPSMESGDGVTLPGSSAAYDYVFRDSGFDLVDNYSRLTGKHALVIGGEFRPGLHDSLLSPARDGLYVFNSISNFFLDDPSLLLISLNRQTGLPATNSAYRRYYYQGDFAGFFQDNLKLTRRLTLNLGLRYEYFGVPVERNGTRDYNFVFGEGQTIGQRIATGGLQTGSLYRPDYRNFAPRFGFALDLRGDGKSVLRAGYGIFYDRVFNNIWEDVRSNILTLQTLINLPGQAPQFRYTFPASQGVIPGAPITPSSTVAVDQGLRTPYAQNWFLGLQQELTSNLVLEVDHAGSLGRKLMTADTINRPFSVPATLDNPNGLFNPGQPQISYRANQGLSQYLALEVGLNRRWSQGVQFQVSYTYSRNMDVQSDPFGRRASQVQSPSSRLADSSFFQIASAFTRQFDPSADYGHADFDQPHNLVFNVIVQVPKSPKWLRPFAGWEISGIAGFRAGFPFSVYTTQLNIPQSGGLLIQNRADFNGKSLSKVFLPNRPPVPGGVQLLDPSVFSVPVENNIGNVPRNAFRGPGFWNTDFAFSRTFTLRRLGERESLQFRVEMYNLFNHANLNNPDPVLGSPTFGQATFGRQGFGSSLPIVSPLNEQPRRIQFAVKLYF